MMNSTWSRWTLALALLLVIVGTVSAAAPQPVYMCNSKIYCQGPILEAVNRLALYNDSKHYVDMPLKKTPTETLQAFMDRFPDQSKITADELRQFLSDFFHEPGGELSVCEPVDWRPEPEQFNLIKDPHYKQWALDLNRIWLQLCRRVNKSIGENSEKTSLIYVPNNFIAPGGRFREYYYWDTYWIVKGLLVSQMYETAKDIIRNFSYLLEQLGFIPNGGRIYYSLRSQPPVFIPMVYEVFAETEDKDFLIEMLPAMEKELRFWKQNRTINIHQNGKNYTVYRYYTASNTPRPESHKEDVAMASHLSDEQKPLMYQHIATAAETGLDFGSRFFANLTDMTTIRTTDILPVDLNAFLCWSSDIMASLHLRVGNHEEAKRHMQTRSEFRDIIDAVFYNSTVGSWFDVDLKTMAHLQHFYPSNAVPLFAGCYDPVETWKSRNFYTYLQTIGALSHPSGIPSSLIETGQQWDSPNGWPPQNHMIIEGFRKSGHEEMQEDAFKIADTWLRVNYLVYQRTKHMYEKYNVSDTTYKPGGGGEYEVQVGFGWTNGVVLDLLRTYGARLVAPGEDTENNRKCTSQAVHSSPSLCLLAYCLILIVTFFH